MDASSSHTGSIFPTRVGIDRNRWVSIRPIERSDASDLFDFYSRLSAESRRRRFLSSGVAPSPAMTARLAGAPGFVGVLRAPGSLDGAIVAHASLQSDGLGSAEVAFAVADELHGHGIGRRLVTLVLEHARALRVGQVGATMLAENTPMRHLLRDAGPPVWQIASTLGSRRSCSAWIELLLCSATGCARADRRRTQRERQPVRLPLSRSDRFRSVGVRSYRCPGSPCARRRQRCRRR